VVAINRLGPGKLTFSQIVRKLESENIFTTRKTVRDTLAKFDKTGAVFDLARPGRPKMVSQDMYMFIDEMMVEDDELTARKLHEKVLAKFPESDVSERTISRARFELGWTYSSTRYCQAIRVANMEKRVDWCTRMMTTRDTFMDVIFTDESTIALETHRKKSFRKKGMPRKLKAVPKHPVKVCAVFSNLFMFPCDLSKCCVLSTDIYYEMKLHCHMSAFIVLT
jgi:transposase